MPNSQPNGVIQLIRKFAAAECTRELSDRQLLERFLVKHNEAAFAALMRRHGPMVLRLCRRVLQNEDDAEDAFQATFLVLTRQAPSLRQHESLVGWLHSVAYRVAQKARIAAARRRKHERRAPERQVADPLTEITLREAHDVFDQELNRLPDKFRAPLVLCYLEGLTRDEAAQHLGWPPSTLKSRLEQARERLRVRLESRGLALSGALVASLFYASTASATVPCALLGSTVKAATTVAAGATATSVVSANVVALAEGMVKAMFMTKLKTVAFVMMAAALIGSGTGAFMQAGLGQTQSEPAKLAAKAPTDDQQIQATWVLVSAVVDGKETPEEVLKEEGHKRIFKADKFIIRRADQPDSPSEVAYKLDATQKPKTIDMIPAAGPDKGNTVPGIYRLEGDTLTVCEGLVGAARPTELTSKAGSKSVLTVFRREDNTAAKAKKVDLAEKTVREVLAQFEKEDPEWKVRMESLSRLVKAGPDAIPVLVEALKDGSPPKRVFAAQVLAILAEPATAPALRKALEDPSPQVRVYAIHGLSTLGRIDPAEPPYRKLLEKDPDRRVRYALAWAFERDDAATAAAVVRKGMSEYDLSKIDTARLDEPAPDFSLTDAFGKTYRRSDFHGKKSVVLRFYHQPL